MVKVVFTFEVAPEKQSEYLKATAENIKPFWESHGCQSYQIWQIEGTATFLKEMHFTDQSARDKAMGLQDAEADSVKQLWNSYVSGEFTVKTHIYQV